MTEKMRPAQNVEITTDENSTSVIVQRGWPNELMVTVALRKDGPQAANPNIRVEAVERAIELLLGFDKPAG